MAADNSYYSETDRGLHFGDGVVDDAEDAEIVLHEFGHAILHNVIPGLGESWEASAIDEGTCDYVAATFSDDAFYPDTIGEWDATGYDNIHTDPPRLRPIVTDRTYPDNMRDPYPLTGTANFHWDGVIWSATLWQCREHLGSQTMDGILLGAFPMFFPGIGFSSAALRLVNSEYFLYTGEYSPTIRYFFNERGILSNSYIVPPVLGTTVNRLVVPLVLENDEYRTLIGILNPSDSETEATIQVVGDNGCIIYRQSETIVPPRGRYTFSPARGRLPHSCWVVIESQAPLNGYTLIQSKDGQKSALIPASTELHSELLVPHIAPETDYWETETSVVNVSEDPAEVRFLETSLPGGTFEATSHPYGQASFNWFSDYYAGSLPEGFSGWGLLTADLTSIAGAEVFHKKGTDLHQMAGLSLSDRNGSVLWFPHIDVQGAYWWTGVVLVNRSASEKTVAVTAWDEAGNLLSTLSLPLEAQTKYVSLVQDLWNAQGQIMPPDTAWIRMETDTADLSGVELFGTLPTSGDRLLAGVNAAVETSPGLIFPHIVLGTDNWAGIAFVNVGPQPATCDVAALNDAGEVLAAFTMTESIPVNAKWVSTARDLFGGEVPDGTTQIRIVSDSELVGFQLWGNSVPQQDHLSGMLAFPYRTN